MHHVRFSLPDGQRMTTGACCRVLAQMCASRVHRTYHQEMCLLLTVQWATPPRDLMMPSASASQTTMPRVSFSPRLCCLFCIPVTAIIPFLSGVERCASAHGRPEALHACAWPPDGVLHVREKFTLVSRRQCSACRRRRRRRRHRLVGVAAGGAGVRGCGRRCRSGAANLPPAPPGRQGGC